MATDPTAHEIIVLSDAYHVSVHYPQGSLYADVWLGISTEDGDLLVQISELRRKALNTSPAEEMMSDSASVGSNGEAAPGLERKDSGVHNQPLKLPVRRASHGLATRPDDKSPVEWLIAKESIFQAKSICATHFNKFTKALNKIQKDSHTPTPDLAPLLRLLDTLRAANAASPGPMDDPSCCICAASPYTRLFFSML